MRLRKPDETNAADAPEMPVETPIVESPATEPQPEPMPDPITAVQEDGTHRPMSGGSFIRLEDGTLIRNSEA